MKQKWIGVVFALCAVVGLVAVSPFFEADAEPKPAEQLRDS